MHAQLEIKEESKEVGYVECVLRVCVKFRENLRIISTSNITSEKRALLSLEILKPLYSVERDHIKTPGQMVPDSLYMKISSEGSQQQADPK
jgi:hypothetical protein